jgi:hypothetical protein
MPPWPAVLNTFRLIASSTSLIRKNLTTGNAKKNSLSNLQHFNHAPKLRIRLFTWKNPTFQFDPATKTNAPQAQSLKSAHFRIGFLKFHIPWNDAEDPIYISRRVFMEPHLS